MNVVVLLRNMCRVVSRKSICAANHEDVQLNRSRWSTENFCARYRRPFSFSCVTCVVLCHGKVSALLTMRMFIPTEVDGRVERARCRRRFSFSHATCVVLCHGKVSAMLTVRMFSSTEVDGQRKVQGVVDRFRFRMQLVSFCVTEKYLRC